MRTTDKLPKPRRLKSSERKAEIVQTALQLAADRNIDTITTEAIAQAMGLTQGALFRHFPTKEAIWVAAVERVDNIMMEAIKKNAEKYEAPLDKIGSIFYCIADLLVLYPGMPQVMFHELQRPNEFEPKEIMRSTLRHISMSLEAIIDEGKAKGEIAGDIDTVIGARMLLGALDGLVTQTAIQGSPEEIGNEARLLFPLLRKALST